MFVCRVCRAIGLAACVALSAATGAGASPAARVAQGATTPAPSAAADLDALLAPVALYPDALLAQMLLCAGDPGRVVQLNVWLKENASLKGSELQEAAQKTGFEPSFVALAPFPQVVSMMADDTRWTRRLGEAFAADRDLVFASIQRLRATCQEVGNLKSTPQQSVETKTTEGGQQVIVIEPSNPQVVYVPQYNPTVVYTQPATTTVVVQEDDDDAAIAAGVIGFAAGIAIGAAIDNDYYYGPYGWRGGGYMYGDAWDDFYDDREDAREDFYDNREDARDDWQDHREDMAGERSDRAQDAREQRGERQQSRSESGTTRSAEAQAQRDERRAGAQGRAEQAGGSGITRETRDAGTAPAGTATSYQSRGRGGERSGTSAERSGTRSDAFSGYSSGRSTRSESARGERSRSGRSRSGGRSRR